MSFSNPPYSLPYLLYRRARFIGSLVYAICLYLPYQCIINAVPSSRPNPQVSLTRTLVLAFIRWFLKNVDSFRDILNPAPGHKILQARLDALGARHEVIPAWTGELRGEVKEAAASQGVTSADVSVFWGGKRGRAEQGDRQEQRLLLCFHGGEYIGNSAHPDDLCAFPATKITEFSFTMDAFCSVDYRLSSIPFGERKSINPFPAAFIHGLTAFKYMLSLGYQACNIYLFGDSAGGNLVLALCRYFLYEENLHIGGLILVSPWADISGSHSKKGLSRIDNMKIDYLGDDCEPGKYNCLAFLGGPDECASPETAYISPACRDIESPTFEGFPRTFISPGGHEEFLDEIKTLHQRMKQHLPDEEIALDITPHAPHDFYVIRLWEPERTELMRRIANWIDAAPKDR